MSGRPVQLPYVCCPSCGGRARAKAVGKADLTFREVYYECRNPDACGHGFVVEMTATRTTKASSYPAPKHKLPLSTWRKADNDRADNDNVPPIEPDTGAATP